MLVRLSRPQASCPSLSITSVWWTCKTVVTLRSFFVCSRQHVYPTSHRIWPIETIKFHGPSYCRCVTVWLIKSTITCNKAVYTKWVPSIHAATSMTLSWSSKWQHSIHHLKSNCRNPLPVAVDYRSFCQQNCHLDCLQERRQWVWINICRKIRIKTSWTQVR